MKDEDFKIFTQEYNRVVKEGIFQDHVNRELLLEIVRYKSSKVDDVTSLDDYIKRAEGREKKEIYYIIGDDEKVLRNSPLLEAYKKADIEVLIMDDKEIDEIVTPSIGTFKEWSLKDITTIDAPESKSKDEIEKVQKELEPLVTRIKSLLEDEIKDVKVTSRLTKSPSCVVKDASDPMASMAHMFAQMGPRCTRNSSNIRGLIQTHGG